MFAHNAKKYLGLWLLAVLLVWAFLLTIRADNPWVDLVIFGEIAITAFVVAFLMFRYTNDWTVRGLGIFGLMTVIFLLYGPSFGQQIRLWGPEPPANIPTYLPDWFVQLRRAIVAVSGPCLLWGFKQWWEENMVRL